MRITRTLESSDNTVRKSLYDSVIRHIMQLAQFPTSATIIYDEELRNIIQPGSSVGEKESPVLGTDRRVRVSISETRQEWDRNGRHVSGHLEEYIYREPRYGIYIYPIPAAFDTTFTLSFRSHSKSEIQRIVNGIMFRQDQGHTSFVTGGEFFYYIPSEIFSAVIDTHNIAQKYDTELPQVDKYLLDNLAEWVTIASDQAGGQLQFAARREVSGIQIIFEAGDIKTDKQETYYSVEINANFTHERPLDIQIDFPLYVAGEPMPDGYHPEDMSPWISQRDGYKNPLIEAADNILAADLFHYPWLATGEFIGSVGKNVSVLFGSDILPLMDDKGVSLLLGIEDLPFELTEPTLKYLRKMQSIDQNMTKSVLRIGYYIAGNRVSSQNVWCDADLNFYTNVVAPIHKRSQIALEVVLDIDSPDKGLLDSMREDPEFLYEYVGGMWPELIRPPKPTIPGPGNLPDPIRPSRPGQTTEPWETIDWDKIKEKPTVTAPVLDAVADAVSKTKITSTGGKYLHVGTIIAGPRR